MRKVIRADRRKSARLLMVAAAAAAGTLTSSKPATAAVRTWINTAATANWTTASNWSSTGTPGSTDSGVISLTDANIHTIVIDNNVPASGGLLGLTADDTNATTGTLEILLNVAGRTFTVGNTSPTNLGGVETLGVSGKMLFEQDNGTHTNTGTGGSFTLGLNATANATYNLTNGLLNIVGANLATIGSSGAGTFNQSGGTTSFNGGITLGAVSTGNGMYNLNAGVFNATNLNIGRSGRGTFTVGSSAATYSGTLSIGGTNTGVGLAMTAGTGKLPSATPTSATAARCAHAKRRQLHLQRHAHPRQPGNGQLQRHPQPQRNRHRDYQHRSRRRTRQRNLHTKRRHLEHQHRPHHRWIELRHLHALRRNAQRHDRRCVAHRLRRNRHLQPDGRHRLLHRRHHRRRRFGQGLYSMSNAVGTSSAIFGASIGDVSAGTFTQTAGSFLHRRTHRR